MTENCQASRKRPPELVKSAVRVLEILELFDRHKQTLMVGEIAAALQYPQSSTSALLRSLVKIGYLSYDMHRRTFQPTHRVAFLGSWQSNAFFVDGPVLEIARKISETLGVSVGIYRRNHISVQWLHSITAGEAGLDPSHDGQPDLLRSSTGYVLLSALGERDIQSLVRRINSEVDSLPLVMRPSDVLKRIDEVCRDGYAAMETGDCTTISVLTPGVRSNEPVALTLFAETRAVAGRMNHIMAVVRDIMARGSGNRHLDVPGVEHLPLPATGPQLPVRLVASH